MPFTTNDSPTGSIITLEAIWQIQLEDFPAFTVVDDKGNDCFSSFMKPQTSLIPPPLEEIACRTMHTFQILGANGFPTL